MLIRNFKEVGNISGVQGPWGICYNPVNGYVYVADYGYYSNGNEVSVINGTKVLGNIMVGSAPWGVAADPSTGYVYVTNFQSRSISIISSGAVMTKIVFSPSVQTVDSIGFH
jgi:YVTN family beta-propeller protein